MRRVGILTSGGDSQGMNTCIYYATKRLLDEGFEVVGIIGGYLGLIEKEVIKLDYKFVENIENRGGTVLGTARFEEFRKKEVQEEAAKYLNELGIDTLICLGGDGTFKGAEALAKLGINVMGIPCTIDNDLFYTDYTIGYKTAVQICLDCIEKLKDTMTSHDRVSVFETMGKNHGYITLEAGLIAGIKFVVIPEREYDVKKIANIIKNDIKNGFKNDMILISEGATHKKDAKDFHEEIEKELGYSIRRNVLGHIQRGGTPVGEDKLLAYRYANEAVNNILNNTRNKIIGIHDDKIVSLDFSDLNTFKVHHNQHYYDELMSMAFDHLK